MGCEAEGKSTPGNRGSTRSSAHPPAHDAAARGPAAAPLEPAFRHPGHVPRPLKNSGHLPNQLEIEALHGFLREEGSKERTNQPSPNS